MEKDNIHKALDNVIFKFDDFALHRKPLINSQWLF